MESTPEQTAEGLVIVRVLAAVLDRLIYTNASLSYSNAINDPTMIVTKFHAMKPPGISIQLYLERIHRYASCSNECFILALIYIDRLIQRNNFILTELNVHRVAVTSVLLAAKFFDDAYYNNAYYAKVGGVLVHEMNGLEVDFLFRINFSLHATPEEFTKYRNELLSHANVGVPSDGIPIMYDDDNKNHDDIAVDATPSPPPAQVSPEITSTSMTAIDHPHNVRTYQIVQEPPKSTKRHHRDNVMIVPCDVEYESTQNGSLSQQSNDTLPSEPSYFGFPLQPQPTFHHQQQHHTRRNSMPLVIPLGTAPLVTATTSPPHYQPPVAAIHSGMPKSDPIHSVRYNNIANHYNLHPMHCKPQFPIYSNNNSMDGTTTTSSLSSNLTSTTTSNSSSSNSYYSGNLILMDHGNRIQQPLHVWDGTPITIVQHHHHGSTTTTNTAATNNATTINISNSISNIYDLSSVGYASMKHHHHHHQQQQSQQPLEVIAMSGVGGMR